MGGVVDAVPRQVGGDELPGHVAVHRAVGHAHHLHGAPYASSRHRHLLAMGGDDHGGGHLRDAGHVAHGLLEQAAVADGPQRVLLLHEQRRRRHPRGLVDLVVAPLLYAGDDVDEPLLALELALVGPEPGKEPVGRLDLALRLGAPAPAHLDLEARVAREGEDALHAHAPASLHDDEGGHVVGDPLGRDPAEPEHCEEHAPDQVVGGPGARVDEDVAPRPAERRREHVELEHLAVAVRHPHRLLPVELKLQSRRGLEPGMGLGAPERPDGDAVAAHELGEGVVSRQPLARVAVDEVLVDPPLGDAGQLGLRPDLLDVGLEGSLPVPAGVARVAAVRLPVGGDRMAVLAVPPGYIAEVRLDASFLVHVQLSDHVRLHGAGSFRRYACFMHEA